MLVRRQIPDIFLGALLAVAVFLIGFVFGSLPHSGSSTEPESAAKSGNTGTQHPEQKNWWNDPVADFTLGLVLVGAFQVGLFYVQLQLIGKSLRDAKIAAEAAKESADAAKISADHIPRVERAYLFLGLDVKSRVVIEQLWGESWPAMETAQKMVIQKGWAISAGEFQGEYKTEFSLTADYVGRARNKKGYILFWGKVVYRDVFTELHESGWCRAYNFESEGWQFAGDETLNYYT